MSDADGSVDEKIVDFCLHKFDGPATIEGWSNQDVVKCCLIKGHMGDHQLILNWPNEADKSAEQCMAKAEGYRCELPDDHKGPHVRSIGGFIPRDNRIIEEDDDEEEEEEEDIPGRLLN